jgi:sulfite exporter TauE/SafE
MTASLLLGLLGSLGHCVGMCSAVIILFDRQPIFQNKLAWILAHAGRITTYSLLGLIFGIFGQTIWAFDRFQATLSILFAIIAFYMASAFIGLAPSPESLFPGLVQRWGNAIRTFKSASLWTSYLLGLLWGLLPCGLVLTALLTAIASTNAVQGMLNMLIFGSHHSEPVRRQMACNKISPPPLVTKPGFHCYDALRFSIRHARICLPWTH